MTLPLKTLALLLLAVVLGIAVGLGFTDWQDQESTAPSSDASGVVPSMKSTAQDPSRAADLSQASDGHPQTLAEWLDGEPLPITTGSGQIRGIVLLDGEPLAGLEMTASVRIPVDSSESDEDDELVDQLMAGVRSGWLRKSLERTSNSDQDGRFTIEGLDDSYSYYFHASGHSLKCADPPPYATGSDLEFNARVIRRSKSTDEGERAPWATGGIDETVLIGSVDCFDSSWLFIVEGHGPVPDSPKLRERLSLWSGSFFSKFIDPGRYTLVLTHAASLGNDIFNSWPIEVEPGFNEVHLVVEPPPAMEVVVWSASGEPIENAGFSWLQQSHGSKSSYGVQPFYSDGNRYFILPRDSIREIFAGRSREEAFLVVHAPGQSNVEVPVDRLGMIEVHFDATSWLDVDVIGYRGSGLEGVLHFTLTSEDGNASSSAMVDWQGGLRLGPVPPGRYQLKSAQNKTRTLRNAEQITTESVHLSVGDNAHTLTLPLLYELTLDLDDELLGKYVKLTNPQGVSRRLFADSRPLVFSQLSAGKYVVRVGPIDKVVHIPEQDSVFFAFEQIEKIEPNAILITGIDPESPAAECDLEVGDQVIAFNGETFSGREHLQAIAFQSMNDPELTLTIIRNGVEMNVTVALKDFQWVEQKLIER